MPDQPAPKDGYTYSDTATRTANAAKLNSCLRHSFISAPDSAEADSTIDCICQHCGAHVPTLLAEWYNYGFNHALGVIESHLDALGFTRVEEWIATVTGPHAPHGTTPTGSPESRQKRSLCE